jgi:hypothetical protein
MNFPEEGAKLEQLPVGAAATKHHRLDASHDEALGFPGTRVNPSLADEAKESYVRQQPEFEMTVKCGYC